MCIPCYAYLDFEVSNCFKVGGYAYATLDFQICFWWFEYTFFLQVKAKS